MKKLYMQPVQDRAPSQRIGAANVDLTLSASDGWLLDAAAAPSPRGVEDRGDGHAALPIQDRLFLDHVRLVYSIARRLLRADGARGSLVDLLRAGMIGLQQATETYDSTNNLSFAQHATSYIRRAIVYDLCSHERTNTSIRGTARRLREAEEELAHCLGRIPEETEVAWCLDIDMATLAQWRRDVECARATSLRRAVVDVDRVITTFDDVVFPSDDAATVDSAMPIDVPEDLTVDATAGALLHQEQEVASVKQAFLQLKDQERLVLSLLYYEGLSTSEVASLLHMSVPLVIQLRAKGLGTLRRSYRRLQSTTDPAGPAA